MSTLENRGLVKRRPHPDDARRVLLALTPKGKKLMATLFPLFNAEEAFVTSGLTAAETSTVARALRKVVAKVEG
jgi:DNA-binding MarR family transcriptional regulator